MKNICLIVITVFIIGCATTNSSNVTYDQAPIGIPDMSTAIVYFMRDHVNPRIRNPIVLIDDKKVGVLPNNSFFWVKVQPGNKLVATKWSWDTGSDNDTIQLNIEAGEVYYVILKQTGQILDVWGSNSRFSSKFFQVDTDVAVNFLDRLKYYSN